MKCKNCEKWYVGYVTNIDGNGVCDLSVKKGSYKEIEKFIKYSGYTCVESTPQSFEVSPLLEDDSELGVYTEYL